MQLLAESMAERLPVEMRAKKMRAKANEMRAK